MEVAWKSFVELLQFRATKQPKDKAFTFLDENGAEEGQLTFEGLDAKAKAVGGFLQSITQPGDRVLLLFSPGLEFLPGFFGCLYAGVIAVPVYPGKREYFLENFQNIKLDAKADICLTDRAIFDKKEHLYFKKESLKNLNWILIDDIIAQDEYAWNESEINENNLVLLQYTSGSTGFPKGVMISHKNLLYNSEMIRIAFGHSKKTIFVGWLPLHHDMGLVGNVLQPLFLGIHCVLMAPATFVANPFIWLQTISRYKATTSGGPNFAYDLCSKKIPPEKRETLDLSSWENAFVGAEPIFPSTLERFNKAFQSCGFKWEKFYPCYGMAEASLLITGGLKNEPPLLFTDDHMVSEQVSETGSKKNIFPMKKFVGCGQTSLDQEVFIVDPDTLTICPEGQVGEVWVKGDNVSKGYWENPKATEEIFQNYLSENNKGPFLRTGDLAFKNGDELFIAGRLKDLIIINGRNHYPQDIEKTVENCHPGINSHGTAAFSRNQNVVEQLIVVSEIKREYVRKNNLNEIFMKINTSVLRNHSMQASIIVLLKPGRLPKTSSNKIQRNLCKTSYQNGVLENIGEWVPVEGN
jgi:acyl-CoA synthetase (AMP-forming)/AMP-acid ligase II